MIEADTHAEEGEGRREVIEGVVEHTMYAIGRTKGVVGERFVSYVREDEEDGYVINIAVTVISEGEDCELGREVVHRLVEAV